jgi:oligopeptide/dipeptide ABC transporter ATP-binding protein
MYAGRIVEQAPVGALFSTPTHPYTRALLRSVPRIDVAHDGPLDAIPGAPPLLWAIPDGCPFRPRCGLAVEACAAIDPPLRPVGDGHDAACLVEAGA